MAERWETLTVDDSPMDTFVGVPEATAPLAGVVVIMHGPGLDDFSLTMAKRFNEAGFASVAPDMYHRESEEAKKDFMGCLGRLRDPQIIRDVDAAFALLAAQPQVDGNRIGITGFCMGGRITYLMAAANQNFKACVPFYGGGIRNAWGDGPSPLERTAEIGCPMLFFFGDQDRDPSPEHREQIEAELAKHGKAYEFQRYADTGHAFMTWDRPQMYNEAAAADAWAKTLAFFGKHLA